VASEHLTRLADDANDDGAAQQARDVLVREVAARLLFVEIFEIAMSDELRALANVVRDAARGPAPS
jgi:hypothetical protein